MRILVYCQHVLGIGHLIRTFEILKALHGHQVTLLLGGAKTDIPVPSHVKTVQLPPLMMDSTFSSLNAGGETSIEEVKTQRIEKITGTFMSTRPDILLVELYPFGRNGFHFELEPLLRLARQTTDCLVASSVRDILVDRDNSVKFEQRVIDRLNSWFDLLLIHSDPAIIRLDKTFSRMADIKVPVTYTGYINRPASKLGRQPASGQSPPLIVASAGGGSVGFELLEAVIKAHRLLVERTPCTLHLFTGPYLKENEGRQLREQAAAGATIQTFHPDLPDELGKAALSISMGGYNTTMDVVTAGCPALIYPFAQNHEQRMRAEHLSPFAPITVLEKADLQPVTLAAHMERALERPKAKPRIRLNGALESAHVLLSAAQQKQKS